MKNLMLAMCCLVLLEGCKSSKKMEKQPAPKKTMVAAHKKAVKKPAQKSAEKSGAKKPLVKKHETRKPAEKAGMQKGQAKKSAQISGMHKVKKSAKDKTVVQGGVGSPVGHGGF